jgi:DNA-binding response OmpR family regulator
MASILLIDDDKSLRTVLTLVLRQAGYSVVEAADGKAGVEIFSKGDFDLVITDLVMPEMEGFEVLATLRKRKPPVAMIVMSGGGRQKVAENLRMAAHMGATVLSKPFSSDMLVAAVSELLPNTSIPVQEAAK